MLFEIIWILKLQECFLDTLKTLFSSDFFSRNFFVVYRKSLCSDIPFLTWDVPFLDLVTGINELHTVQLRPYPVSVILIESQEDIISDIMRVLF